WGPVSVVTATLPRSVAVVFPIPQHRTRRVFCNDGEVFLSLPHQLVDHAFWGTNGHEAANHQRRAVGDHGDGVFHGNRFHIWPLRDDVKSSLRQHTEQHKRLDIDENQNERSASSWRREPDRSKNPCYCAKWQTIRRSSVDM